MELAGVATAVAGALVRREHSLSSLLELLDELLKPSELLLELLLEEEDDWLLGEDLLLAEL